MATQKHSSSRGSKNEMVACDYCGEVYSSTYRTCPFCDESNHRSRRTSEGGTKEGGTSTTSRGRRVAKTTRGGGYGKPAYLNQVIFLVVTLVLIIAACWIVGKTIGPLLNRDDPTVDPSIGTTVDPDDDGGTTTPDIVEPDITVDPDDSVVIQPTVTAITLSHSDVTLSSGETFTLTPTVSPASSDAAVTWTSSSSAATVSLSGLVTNVNTGSSTTKVIITATAGGVSSECIVYCKPGASDSSTGSVTTNRTGVVSGASAGLNVRAGAGTTFDIIASLSNGNEVTVLDTSTSGWYQISFTNSTGNTATGYVSSTYITLK